jgi:hypothetical protein
MTTKRSSDPSGRLPPSQDIPPPLPKEQIDALQHEQKFWRSIVDHHRAVKLKKIKTKTAMNWNNLLLGTVAIIGILLIILGTIAAVALHTLQAGFYKASEDILTVVSEHPAIAAAAYLGSQGKGDSQTAFIAAVASEISAGGQVQGSFKGHWTTETSNALVKIDPAWIDKYSYKLILYNLSNDEFQIQIINAMNGGFERVSATKEVLLCQNGICDDQEREVSGGYTIYSRNEHTCAYKIVPQEQVGVFVPETVAITKVDASYQGIGKS